jgi:predicted permease
MESGMNWLRVLALRVVAIFGSKQLEKQLDEDLRTHLAMSTEENVRQGMSAEEARFAALRSFGNIELVKEIYREQRGVPMIETLFADVRFALRQLGRSPGLAAVVVLSLAFGIGANTAIFSLMDAVMLKSLPVKRPQQLVLLQWATAQRQGPPDEVLSSLHGNMWETQTGGMMSTSFSYPAFEEFRARNKLFSDVFAFQNADRVNMNIAGQASLVDGEMVTGDYFSGLGVAPVLGRTITDADENTAAPPVAVISYGLWKTRFGGSSSVMGRTVTLNGVPFTLVGVVPAEFFGVQPGSKLDLWVPISTQPRILPQWDRPGESWFTERSRWWVVIMGRLEPGVTRQQALAAMKVLFAQSMTAGLAPQPKAELLPRIQLVSASQGLNDLRKQFSRPLWVLMTLVGLVLLIACGNVANLLLARATARRREIAVRLAIGAGRGRLVRQLLTESILLAGTGGASGLFLAFWGTHILLALMASGRDPVWLVVHPDLAILSFTAAVSLFTGVLFGLAPALRATRIDLTPALKENAGTPSAGGGGKLRLSRALVVAQVAGCMLLLSGAGLFVRTLENLENQNFGFNQDRLLLFKIDPTQAGYHGSRLVAFYQQLLARIQFLPGVESASFSSDGLIGAGMAISAISVEGYTPKQGGGEQNAWTNHVGPDFFRTTGIKLLLGRAIGVEDTEKSPKIAVVNEALARQIFGNANPIGHRFSFGRATSSNDEVSIVGVVENAKYEELRKPAPPTVYTAYPQIAEIGWPSVYFEIRTAGDPLLMVPTLRRVVSAMDKEIPLSDVRTENEKIDQALMQERVFARLSSFFGGLALLLACAGLYGVMSYSVVRRTGEIGIRMALGAPRRAIRRMVLRETAVLVTIGIAIGLPLTLACTRWISSFLFGLRSNDVVTIATAAAFLAAVALFSGYWPARRASCVDPLLALRCE